MIEIKNLCKNYKDKVVYNHLNLSFEEKQITSLMGPSGCGKTTLLKILAGLEAYEGGQITGMEAKKIAYVFQEDRLLPWLTVRENIEYVLMSWEPKAAYKKRVDDLLEMLELTKEQNQLITTLSGGMKRRVALGRALAYEGEILLMDEPFKGLDEALKQRVIEGILRIYQQKKPTIICVTHELEEAKALGKVIEIKNRIERERFSTKER